MAIAADDTGLSVTYACPGDVLRRMGIDALDEAEFTRAALMTNGARHQHFIAGRTLLRHCLSTAVDNAVQPDEWRFKISEHGKPSVISGLPQVEFSLSHTEGLVAVATNPAARIGIDVELVTGTQDTGPAPDLLTRREQVWLKRQSDADRWPAFLKLWTAKEAMSKAVGRGCDLDFRKLEIDVPAGLGRCPYGLLDTGDHMAIDIRTMDAQDATYCLSIAGVHTPDRETLDPPKRTCGPVRDANTDLQHRSLAFPFYSSLHC